MAGGFAAEGEWPSERHELSNSDREAVEAEAEPDKDSQSQAPDGDSSDRNATSSEPEEAGDSASGTDSSQSTDSEEADGNSPQAEQDSIAGAELAKASAERDPMSEAERKEAIGILKSATQGAEHPDYAEMSQSKRSAHFAGQARAGLTVAQEKGEIGDWTTTWRKSQNAIAQLRRGASRQQAAERTGLDVEVLNNLIRYGQKSQTGAVADMLHPEGSKQANAD
ncbi:MAG: hypothetical protein BRC58_09490 [Cyanobacteria bacterium QS_8_64_29]|nr:MAG: hypothetical protein BRC58_09490 [Cyanobacteria bacterium QS_8_64_29]